MCGLHTHSTNILFFTGFECLDIPLLRRCRITPYMRVCVRGSCIRACMHACVCACVHAE